MNSHTTNSLYSPFHRREFLKFSAAGLASWATIGPSHTHLILAESGSTDTRLVVEDVSRTTVRIPYRDVPRRAMDRELPHWRYSEIFEITLRNGLTGIGETLLFYTWGVSTDKDVQRVLGKNAASLMWDDSLGAGLQMALFDAVAKTVGVPIHRLLGKQIYEQTPLSWWNIDMPAQDMVSECREAMRMGYMSYKTKGRPWFDLWQQVESVAQAVPAEFKLDMDFNDTLLDASRGIPILTELEKYPQIDIYETPIPQGDIQGNKAIRNATRVNIAMHYGNPPPVVAIREQVCDGFVVGGGANRLMQTGSVAAMADMPFWLQLVGTGITAAFSLHFGAVLSHARWPAVNCHQLYQHDLLTKPIEVKNGFAKVPQSPGLGYELDHGALKRFRVPKPKSRPEPERLLETSWLDGRRMYVASTGKVNFILTLAMKGQIPYFIRGVNTRLLRDDGSKQWRQLYQQAREKPVIKK